MSETIQISTYGVFIKALDRNAYNGNTYFQVKVKDVLDLQAQFKYLSKDLYCKGIIPNYTPYTPLKITGEVKRFGKLNAKYYIKCTCVTEFAWGIDCCTDYLKNISEDISYQNAKAIAELCEGNIFDYVENHCIEDLSNSAHIPMEKASILHNSIRSTRFQRELYSMLSEFEVPWSITSKMIAKYGLSAIDELKNNPYKIGTECGISFEICDRIAKKLNFSAMDKCRIQQILLEAMNKCSSSGHAHTYENMLCGEALRLIKRSAYKEKVPITVFIDALQNNPDFIFDYLEDGSEGIYSASLHSSENGVAKNVARLINSGVDLPFDDDVVSWVEKNAGNITYAPEQRKCFELIKRSGVAIVTGGPGTGKSTVINGLINAYSKLNPEKTIKLCAPTGRAAQRMSECTGKEATTIHRLLEYKPFGDEISYKNADDPLEGDLFVVDEVSMLDIEIANIFLSAVPSGSLVLFVGDINQLPSVGPGDVLNDMLQSEVIPSVHLVTVYRQGLTSPIVQNAIRINSGVSAFIENDEYRNIVIENDNEIIVYITMLAMSLYNPCKPFDMQILCPTHKGSSGVANINKSLQSILNPQSKDKKEIRYGSRLYRVKDKVVLQSNNYKIGYYNGDLGIIKDIEEDFILIELQNREIRLPSDNFDDLNLAYAMTIHRSQGSEFANVIVVMPAEAKIMLKRNLLYTAITRAKKRVVVIASRGAIPVAVDTTETGARNSRLKNRLIDELRKDI